MISSFDRSVILQITSDIRTIRSEVSLRLNLPPTLEQSALMFTLSFRARDRGGYVGHFLQLLLYWTLKF